MTSTIGTTAWLCLGLVLGACTSGASERFRLPDGELSVALGERLAGVLLLDDGTRLQVSDMRLRIVPGTDRVRADFGTRVEHPGIDTTQIGPWALDARLHWSAQDCALHLVQVEMDLPPTERPGDYQARQREIRHAATWARLLEGQAVWAPPRGRDGCAAMRLHVGTRSLELVPVR